MGSFREFIRQQDFVEFVQNVVNQPQQPQTPKPKVWSAKKDQVIQFWKNLRPNTPIYLVPMAEKPDGGTKSYGEDGIRISGSWNFISSILSRLKELLNYESPNTKLRLIFRGVDKTKMARSDRESYVFYLNLEKRGTGKAGRPQKPKKGLL